MRMRVAMGLVAAERSPIMNARIREDREFALVMWLLALFVLFHAVIFAILFSVPR
jgi:nitrogen fixation/metabolism regulation signal transduction histidine kinase